VRSAFGVLIGVADGGPSWAGAPGNLSDDGLFGPPSAPGFVGLASDPSGSADRSDASTGFVM
jgi:hypothetical protein